MTENQPETRKKSVMLTIDAESYALSTVDLAVEIAASLQTGLHGLFVENEDLIRVAELPFSREITFPTAQERATDGVIMQRSLRAMAEQFRNYLAEAARLSQVPWSYDYLRGRSHDIGLKSELDVTYTIVGKAVTMRPKSTSSRRPRRLLLVENHSPHLIHALQAVIRRFNNEAVEITVIKSLHKVDTASFTAGREGASVRVTRVEKEYAQLSSLLEDPCCSFDYIIVSRQEPLESLREILKKSPCPVILVS